MHIDVASERAHVFACLMRPDAHASSPLGRIEGPKQPVAQEVWLHASARIAHRDRYHRPFLAHLDTDFALARRRILGVTDHVFDHTREMLLISFDDDRRRL